MTLRRVDVCIICRDFRPIVSHGRCATCLMQIRREAMRRGEPVYNPQEFTLLRELNKYLSRFVKAATAIEDGAVPETFISAAEHQTVRRIIRETIDKIQMAKRETEHQPVPVEVNGSQEIELTVNNFQDEEPE
jgi:hypothetical protein